MRLYTAGSTKQNRLDCIDLGVGIMIADGWRDPSQYPFFAVDNGAFSAWKRGVQWDPAPFLRALGKCEDRGLIPDFAVLPDIVGGGNGSLEWSERWLSVLGTMYPDVPFALAVQDGMDPEAVEMAVSGSDRIATVFVGGTMDWKLRTLRTWTEMAHRLGRSVHVGRIGTVERMMMCRRAGVDSIDSTTWVQRNGSLRSHVEMYVAAAGSPSQQTDLRMFEEEP